MGETGLAEHYGERTFGGAWSRPNLIDVVDDVFLEATSMLLLRVVIEEALDFCVHRARAHDAT